MSEFGDLAGKAEIYNGIEAPHVDSQPISFDPPRLLCLGRFRVAEKGFDLALTAFATIRDRFPGLHCNHRRRWI